MKDFYIQVYRKCLNYFKKNSFQTPNYSEYNQRTHHVQFG